MTESHARSRTPATATTSPCVIPALNEALRIREVVEGALRALRPT